jgi:hypothetical protein
VVGVGLEYGFAPNWTAGIEYDYLFRESDSRTFLTPNLAIGPFTANTRSDVSMITGRISYKFGGYGYGSPAITDLICMIIQQTKAPALSGAFLFIEFDEDE